MAVGNALLDMYNEVQRELAEKKRHRTEETAAEKSSEA